MSYENAPGTKLVATNCACCNRPLLDATSVEVGVGPDCRAKHGFIEAQAEPDWRAVAALALDGCYPTDARQWANKLVHEIAADPTNVDTRKRVAALFALGYRKLASKIAERFGVVVVSERDAATFSVATPFSTAWNDRCYAAWWKFDKPTKTRIVPKADRAKLYEAIVAEFAPCLCVGPKGMSVLTTRGARRVDELAAREAAVEVYCEGR